MRKTFIIMILLLVGVTVYSQPDDLQNGVQLAQMRTRQNRDNSTNTNVNNAHKSEKFSAVEYGKQQRAFLIKQAELSQEEAEAFFSIYNELQQKKRALNREARAIMRQEGGAENSEEQSLKAIDAQADVNIKIAQLEKDYLEKFKTVLPASKILKIQNAEYQFNSQMLKDIQQSRSHKFPQGNQEGTVSESKRNP